LTIQIDGAGQRASKSDGVDVKWSRHSQFEAKVEMVAHAARGTSEAAAMSQSASAYKPSSAMEALQNESSKCKQDDTACQMAVAMKMMETDDAKALMAQAEDANKASPRFQSWQLASKGRQPEIKAEYLEQWDGVFLTASKEVRNCKVALPATAALSAKDRETLVDGLKGVNLEVDTQTGKSSLLAAMVLYVGGELKCHIDDGGRVSDESESKAMSFSPPVDGKSTVGWIAGSSVSGAAIARGEMSIDTKAEAHSLTGMMSVTAPLKIKIRWELTSL
jgi:hypothetical protein